MKKINKKIPLLANDENRSDINPISSKLYKEYELNGFYLMAKSHKFDITLKIVEWINMIFLLFEQTEHPSYQKIYD